ncbi:hypothetical protein KM043_003714 [Ampulex compressa]|nr:hypothetical protein KM043_003714 [Ampulex compressa]
MSAKPIFSKPGDSMWQEDKPDIDAHSSTQFVYNAHHSLAMDMQRQRLPIFKYKSHIIYLLEKYQTLVLIGETGCGKSTQLPQMKSPRLLFEIGRLVVSAGYVKIRGGVNLSVET